MLEVDVLDVVCGECGSTVKYNGLEDAILNQDATALFTREFLQGCAVNPYCTILSAWGVGIHVVSRGYF
jgi:hypothetical protein